MQKKRRVFIRFDVFYFRNKNVCLQGLFLRQQQSIKTYTLMRKLPKTTSSKFSSAG